MQKNIKSGSVIGGMLLVAGSCIGAGMLALPIITGLCGFIPSIFLFLLSWAFMTLMGLFILEVNSWFDRQVNFVSMVGFCLGKIGRILSWFLYLFLFYSLLVAYIAQSGTIASSFIFAVFSYKTTAFVANIFFVLILGYIVFWGTKSVDYVNRYLMVALIISYIGVLFFGFLKIHIQNLSHIDWSYSLFPLPILITSFGFHNMIPSLTEYMGRDIQKMRKVIIGGSFIVLGIYLLWNAIILGVIPFEGTDGLKNSYFSGKEASQVVNLFLGKTKVGGFVQSFAFFAIVTSVIAQALGLTHFLADGFQVSLSKKNRAWLVLLTLIPPFIFAGLYPNIFYHALSFAGGGCAVILFGVLPSLMIWVHRYKRNSSSSSYQVFGGKPILIIAMLYALFIFILEVLRLFER